MIWGAVRAGFGYFQREAGYTRTGSHHARVNGRETGQWHEAGLAVAHWLQHTSRDGDMQLHIHSQIAHTARTQTDGKWRAPDSLGYNEHLGAVAAITAQHLEEALTRRFGVQWVARDDGHGFEIKGISGQMMRLFSSRRESITADLHARAARFQQRYGRAPSQRELAQLAQASNFTTRKAKDGALDVAQLHKGWADKLARTLGVPLASVAPSVWHDARGHAAARKESPDPLELARAAQKAVALAQQEKSAWTRADLIKYLGRVLPRTGMEPATAAALLEDLADRALRSEFEPVICLEAPEAVEVPRSLLRADGRSIYQRHGGVRYATRAQLAMEERLVAQAGADTAPRLTRAGAARALGADLARLEDTLAERAQETQDHHPERTGLTVDQAAAVLSVLTDGKRVSVINAPAGSGKTRVMTEAARVWTAAGRPVIGLTPSQSARNTLAAGVTGPTTPPSSGHLPVSAAPAARSITRTPCCWSTSLDDPTPTWSLAEARAPRWPVTPASCRRSRTAAPCPCSPAHSDTSSSPTRSGSAPHGSRPPACGSAQGTPRSWPNTTSTAGSPAASPSRCSTLPQPPTPRSPWTAPTPCSWPPSTAFAGNCLTASATTSSTSA